MKHLWAWHFTKNLTYRCFSARTWERCLSAVRIRFDDHLCNNANHQHHYSGHYSVKLLCDTLALLLKQLPMAQVDNLKDSDQPVLWYWIQSLVYSISIMSISFIKTHEIQLSNLSWFSRLLSPGSNHWHFLTGSKYMSRILNGCLSESPGKNSDVSFAF